MTGRHEHRPIHRFSGRVDAYIRYRPGYPPALLDWLRAEIGLAPAWEVADIGSGTGFFASLLLANGNRVYGVEPNDTMRAAAERALAGDSRFVSVRGTAEATGLPDASIDLVSAAQAFHWFDPAPTRREWKRILRPEGRVLIVFNSRRIDASPFMRAYDDFLAANAVDYREVDHRRVLGERLREFLADAVEWRHPFTVRHDFAAVKGLSASASYVPSPDHPGHAAFMEGLERIFDAHATDGCVEFLYETEAYTGRLA
jgi:SAM-dependent methyltransferase